MLHKEQTLVDVLRDVWRAKIYLFFFGIFSLICAFIFIQSAVPHYKAEMIVAPAHSFPQSLVGIPEGSIQVQGEALGGDAAFARFAQTYSLPSVVDVLLKAEGIKSGLKRDRSFAFSNEERAFDVSYFKQNLRLEPVSGTVFKRFIYMHPDPEFAVRLLSLVHGIADEQIRRSVLRETNERITYLNEAMGRSVNPEHKRNLAELMMEQERMRMMVSLDQPFAASVIESAYVSAKPRWPDPFIIYPVFLFVGLLLGFVTYGFGRHG